MATTTRQTGLLVNQDWTKLYQTFRSADFQSYDYETLRKSMVDYLRLYYPEDFNDFIESSEFIALIDLIAFLGQSLSFRGDLNARENFIDTAQRRDSILKLARLISYTPKRNITSTGFLKVDSVSTSETVYDSNGLNLAGLVINWADSGNDNWQEQFTAIINASLQNNQVVGKPSNSAIINGITHNEYQINLISNLIATYAFKSAIEGNQTQFEMVSPTSVGKSYVYESNPKPNSPFNLLYKNDNLGNGSNNTGFFLFFKQGNLASIDFNLTESIPNRVYGVNVDNINNTDVWLYSVDQDGNLGTLWTQVPAVGVTNVIFNQTTVKTIYQINSRANDQIDIVFGDGAFAEIPQGQYRLYYRVSSGLSYKITPDEMRNIIVPISYVSRSNRIETITIRASLRYTVTNATARESLNDIRQKAPQQYYTQNRMITSEDYNILPYTLFSDILKVKAVNRTSSGISRYLDVVDVTGKYSSTNIFCDDGMLYRDSFTQTFSFSFDTVNDIYKQVLNKVKPIASAQETLQFFYAFMGKIGITNAYWNKSPEQTGLSGYLYDSTDKILQVGNYVSDTKQYIKQGAIIKFSAGDGNYFDAQNNIQTGTPRNSSDKYFIYAPVSQVLADGTNGGAGDLSNGSGPITLTHQVPTGAVAVGVFPAFNNNFTSSLVTSIVGYIQAFENFGLRYDVYTSSWKIVLPQDIQLTGGFSQGYAGNSSGQGLDASWIISFQPVGKTYNIVYRGLNYIFESTEQTDFYYDGTVKIYDQTTGLTIYDQINVLKVNAQPDNPNPLGLDYSWYVYKNVTDVDGFQNPNKILVTFSDSNNDGIPDNPELFEFLVGPDTNTDQKYVYFQNTFGYNNFVIQNPIDNAQIVSTYTSLGAIREQVTLYSTGQIFYIPDLNIFYKLTINGSVYNLDVLTGYTAKIGRQDLYFQYRHNSPNDRRIDPSPNNIIDLYILTNSYSTDYVAWIQDTSGKVSQPSAPTPEQLGVNYSSLNDYKAISDTIIYNPSIFKPIFGDKADTALRATFKVVKNPNIVVSDNDIKTSVISAINKYFDIANWDFGETFYFSELAAYLHKELSPNVASIILVPASASEVFGSLLQINANFNEIIISCATVDNVQVISAITAAQLNQNVLA
jgi:RNase P/RNase MRP subunit p29